MGEWIRFMAVISILLIIYLLVSAQPVAQQEAGVGDIIPGCVTVYRPGEPLICGSPDAVDFK